MRPARGLAGRNFHESAAAELQVLGCDSVARQANSIMPVSVLVVTGASGAGKTASVEALAARALPGVRCFHFDSIGVPIHGSGYAAMVILRPQLDSRRYVDHGRHRPFRAGVSEIRS